LKLALGGSRPQVPQLAPLQIGTSTSGSSAASADSRSGSFGESGQVMSTSSSMAYNLINPSSAVSSSTGGGSPGASGMQRENSLGLLPDLEKLRIDLGRDLDVEDLDDSGWKAASKQGRIEELGSLGEGAGGAVNRCILKGGKTVFALKVCPNYYVFQLVHSNSSIRS
jgi:mitogen-activated protein kinase kinase